MGNHNIGLEGPIKLLISTKKRRKRDMLYPIGDDHRPEKKKMHQQHHQRMHFF